MKIAVVGYPRTGSTKLCYVLEQLFPTRFVGEILTRSTNVYESVRWVNQHRNIVVKLFTKQLKPTILNDIDWKQFDLICFTFRKSLVDSFISLYIANERNQWIRGINDFKLDEPFTVDVSKFSEYHKNYIAPIGTITEFIKTKNNNTITLYYDEIADTPVLLSKLGYPHRKVILPISATGIDYSVMCLNYEEIKTIERAH